MPSIHPTALIHPTAVLGPGVSVGPWCVIDAGTSIGAGSTLGAFCRVHSGAELDERVTLDGGAVIGGLPQDLKYGGGPSRTLLGSGTRVGEYATVNRSASAGNATIVGRNCLIMAYAHVAHDCLLGDGAIVANGVQLGGHVRVGAGAVVSGMTGVHQFTSIGAGAFVGGGLRIDKDVPPYCRALGEPPRWGGLNLTGLRRGGADADTAAFLDGFYRKLYGKDEAVALEWMKEKSGFEVEKNVLRDFFTTHTRGMLRRGDRELGVRS